MAAQYSSVTGVLSGTFTAFHFKDLAPNAHSPAQPIENGSLSLRSLPIPPLHSARLGSRMLIVLLLHLLLQALFLPRPANPPNRLKPTVWAQKYSSRQWQHRNRCWHGAEWVDGTTSHFTTGRSPCREATHQKRSPTTAALTHAEKGNAYGIQRNLQFKVMHDSICSNHN